MLHLRTCVIEDTLAQICLHTQRVHTTPNEATLLENKMGWHRKRKIQRLIRHVFWQGRKREGRISPDRECMLEHQALAGSQLRGFARSVENRAVQQLRSGGVRGSSLLLFCQTGSLIVPGISFRIMECPKSKKLGFPCGIFFFSQFQKPPKKKKKKRIELFEFRGKLDRDSAKFKFKKSH